MGTLTVHIECTGSWERGKKLLASAGVETAMLLNANPEQIQYTLDNTTGIVEVRVYDPFNERASLGADFEKDILTRKKTDGSLVHSPSDFVAWLNSKDLSRFKGNKRVRFALGWCEMYYNGANYQIEQNKRMIAVADALVKAGYGVAMFGMASDKTLQSSDIDSGVWDTVIDFAIANAEWVHIDIHEYEVGRLASQHLKAYPVNYPYSIEHPFAMRQENWGTIDYNLARNGNWHIGRISWLLVRSRYLHGKDFLWSRGEMGWDYKDDGALRSYIPEYMGRYGKPQGLPSLRPLFNHLADGRFLSDTELCQEAYKDLDWFVSQDPKSCLSNAIFADNTGSDHKNFHLGQPAFEYLYTLLGQQKPMGEITPAPIPTPIPLVERQIKSTSVTTYIRDKAQGEIIGAISNAYKVGKISQNYAEAKLEAVSSAKAWVQVEFGMLKGYSAAPFLDVQLVDTVPPPPPPEKRFVINLGVIEVTESELVAMKKLVAALETKLNEAVEKK